MGAGADSGAVGTCGLAVGGGAVGMEILCALGVDRIGDTVELTAVHGVRTAACNLTRRDIGYRAFLVYASNAYAAGGAGTRKICVGERADRDTCGVHYARCDATAS